MSEMLGNFYFHQRKFLSAQKQLENSLQNNPSDLIKKKLIICYTQSGEIDKALQMLYELVNKNIYLIVCTNIREENCPCTELIFEIENNQKFSMENYRQTLVLGMLWLYCDINKSYSYFLTARSINPENIILLKVIEIVSQHLTHKNLKN